MKPKSSTNYKKIVDAVLDQINHGQLQKGDKLPTELSLATKFDVSRTCVREAIKSLEAMGIVQSIQAAARTSRTRRSCRSTGRSARCSR